MRDIMLNTEQELFAFLKSEESLKMWSTHTDIAVLANMCNLTVHTFTYNIPNQPPSWSATPPDPYLPTTLPWMTVPLEI